MNEIPLCAWHYGDVLTQAVQNQQRPTGSRHAICPFRYLMHRVHASLCKRAADERWKLSEIPLSPTPTS